MHECNSGKAVIDNEDVKIVGDWVDYTGSGVEQNVMMKGAENKLFGKRAALDGNDLDPQTIRGNNAATTRSRQHIEFINLKGDGFREVEKLKNEG